MSLYAPTTSPGTTLLLIRHAHSTMAARFCGHSNPPLSDAGREQLPEIIRGLEPWPVVRVCTSDLKRAYDTAAAIAASRSLSLVVRPGLREINFGEWEGRSWEEIEASDPASASEWLARYPLTAPPGGESFADYRAKVEKELRALLEASGQECSAVITHAGFIRTTLAMILGIPEKSMHQIELEYGGMTVLHHAAKGWMVGGVNL